VLKRIILLSMVALVTVAMMVASAMPAFAQGNSGTAPNCETGQLTASLKQLFNPSENDDPDKHTGKLFGCIFR
jgi:hypothetical protein